MKLQRDNKNYIFDWKGAVALIGGLFTGILLVSLLNVVSIFVFNENLQYKDFYLILSNGAAFLGAIAAFDFLVVRPETGRKLNFNFAVTNFATYLLIFPMMLGMMFIAEFITGKIPITGPFFGELYEIFARLMDRMTADMPTLFLVAVFMAPLFEEIIFRGIIQKGLMNKGVKPWQAIAVSALLFGLVHGNPWQFVGAVLLGAVLGLVYYKTKSLLLPILLHAFNNLCSCLLIYYRDTESFSAAFNVSEYLIFAVGVLLFGVFYYFFTKKYRIYYSEK